jgi:hypothetical protein
MAQGHLNKNHKIYKHNTIINRTEDIKMKISIHKIIPGITLIMMIQCAIFAQANLKDSTPAERAKLTTEWMQEKLSLEPGQTDAVYKINLEYAAKNIELMNSNESRRSKFRKMRSYEKDKDKELKGLLTKTQFDIYQERKEELREIMKERIKEKRNRE